jgi:alcohol dehydrogenase
MVSSAFSVFAHGLVPFDFQSRTRLVFGPGSSAKLPDLVQELNARSALLVTDAGIVAAGHAEELTDDLAATGVKVTLFDRVRENPTTRDVDDCLAVARECRPEVIIGLGGGSSMDTAKGCNFLLTNGGRMRDYWGVGKATKPMLPLIAVPTTAGTGSECQSAALIADEETHQKMACLDPKAAARVAILDPVLTLSQPPRVTACTGIDAVAHAVETAVTRKRNLFSSMCSREAFRLLAGNFRAVIQDPGDIVARGRMQWGAALAGTAIENSMLGAAHSAANPLTAHFNVVHGQAAGMMLPHVVRFNGQDEAARAAYAELVLTAGLANNGGDAVAALATEIDALLRAAGMPVRLRDCGVRADAIPALAAEAARQWTAGFNPRPVTDADFIMLFEAAF